MTESALVIEERISRFIQSPQAPEETFEDLALAAFASDWRQVPMVPAADLETAAETRSFSDLDRQAIDASFPRFCLPHLPAGARLPVLSLIPSREQLPDSGISFLADHVLSRWGSPESATLFGNRVEVAKARSWTGARQREGRPVLVLATAAALAQWLDGLDRLDLRFRLPPGSVIFQADELEEKAGREELLRRTAERLGVPASQVVRGYGMRAPAGGCYTRALYGEDPGLFVAPPWVRVRILDPGTLEDSPAGSPGLIAVFHLAHLAGHGSAVHVLTEDLGIRDGMGFRLHGAASGR